MRGPPPLALCDEALQLCDGLYVDVDKLKAVLCELRFTLQCQEDLRDGRNARRRQRRAELIARGIRPKRYERGRHRQADDSWRDLSDPLECPIIISDLHAPL